MRLTQGSPPALAVKVAEAAIKPNRIGDPEAGQGAKGGRFTGSTYDSGPLMPGNRAEDKTPATRIKPAGIGQRTRRLRRLTHI